MTRSAIAALESVLEDIRSGEFLEQIARAEQRREISAEEREERIGWARQRLAHYEQVGDKTFARIEREGIAWLQAM
ncbi:MAG: hypothetical protein QM648_10940 [Solirubrobacterales bacterium]